RLDPADELDHQIDVLSVHQRSGVRGEQPGIYAGAVSVSLADRNADKLQRSANRAAQISRLPDDQPRHLRADYATTEHGHPERCERWNVKELRGLHAGQSHRNLIYTTRPRPRIVAVSLFPIPSRALHAYRATNRAQFRRLQSFLLHPASSANKSSMVSRLMSVVISPPRTATTGGRGT